MVYMYTLVPPPTPPENPADPMTAPIANSSSSSDSNGSGDKPTTATSDPDDVVLPLLADRVPDARRVYRDADGRKECAVALLTALVGLFVAALSVFVRVSLVHDKITYPHGVFILAAGFVFFVALTRFWQTLLLRTANGRAFCGRHRLLRSDALEITNKLVSAIQAITSTVAGFMVCTSSCRRSFLSASHYMSDTYAWFGCAYFVYDLWSMYEVHRQRVYDKFNLLRLQVQRKQRKGAAEAVLYDKIGEETKSAASVLKHRKSSANTAAAESASAPTNHGDDEQMSDAELERMLHRLRKVSKDRRTRFWRFLAANPVMTVHHVFLQSFGLFVIVYLRGSFGDCVYGFVYLMEFSTPFVCMRSILSTLQLKDSRAYIVNGLVMLVAFFVCRVAMWPSLFVWYAQIIGQNVVLAVWSLPITCKVGTLVLFVPQIYWFYLMVRGAIQVFFTDGGGSSDRRGAAGAGAVSSAGDTKCELQQSPETIQ